MHRQHCISFNYISHLRANDTISDVFILKGAHQVKSRNSEQLILFFVHRNKLLKGWLFLKFHFHSPFHSIFYSNSLCGIFRIAVCLQRKNSIFNYECTHPLWKLEFQVQYLLCLKFGHIQMDHWDFKWINALNHFDFVNSFLWTQFYSKFLERKSDWTLFKIFGRQEISFS